MGRRKKPIVRACVSGRLAAIFFTALEVDVELGLKSHRHRFLRGVLFVVALATLTTTALATTSRAFAQSDVLDAPTAVAVYSIESQKLEVRWSTSDAANTTSFKIQWKSGSEEFDSTRQLTSDPATSIESDQSTSAGDRYVDIITGLTDGTEYTVRVTAANSNGDSDASATATGTPASQPGQAREFWENEVVKVFEGSFPWLRETWDHITTRNAPVDWAEVDWEAGFHGAASVLCNHSTPSKLRECYADAVSLSRSYPNLIYGIAHELAHVYTLANNVTATPGPLGVARLYFHELTAGGSKGGSFCTPIEIFADALVIVTLGDRFVSSGSYWARCSLTTDTVTEQALAVVRSALSGQTPSWFGDTYNDSNGNLDLARVWADVKAISAATFAGGGYRATVVFQLRDAFGGYCDNQKATDSAFGSGVTVNPWRDGGCVPEAPANMSVTAVGKGKLTVSWQGPPLDEGGSPLEGYKVQWKTGTQEYDSSRQVVVTDLTKIVHLQTITGLTNDESHTVRVLAYNHNGDGAGAEVTATPTATDTTAPVLLLTRFDSRSVRLIWNEALDETSQPEASAFTVNVNGVGRRIYEVAVLDNAVWLSVDATITTTDELTVRYVIPTGSGATPLRDYAGNNAPGIATRTVRNDRIQIVFTDPGPDKTYILGRGFGGQDSIEATVTFSEPVTVTGVTELAFEFGGEARVASYQSGSGTKSLAFRYQLNEGETDSEGIWVRSSGNISKITGPGVVRYASTKAVVPARLWNRITTDYLVDAVRPTLVRANALANGNDVTLTWDKALDEDLAPTITGTTFFEVLDTSDNTSRQITAISVLGKVVTLTLSSAISATDRLTVSYEDPFFRGSDVSFDNHKPLRDTLGNHAAVSSAAVSITRSANSAPEFPSSETGARSVDENTPARRNIGTPIGATDADNDRRRYSISGTDAALFEVVATSGQLRTKGALDHESRMSYSFTMSVTDNKDIHGYADTVVDDTISVTVTVNDVDEGPMVTGDTAVSVDENTENFSRFYSATDPEGAASTYTWSLSGTDSGDFDIDSSTGELTFRTTPDYEKPTDSNRNNEYLVTVQATDQDNLRGTLAVTVTVSDVNEAPTVTGIETTSFAENGVRPVATYRASDPERDTITWTVSGTDSDDFEISETGVLTFASIPDFENPADSNQDNDYLVTVEAQDDGFNTGTLDVTVTVTNSTGAEEPTITTTRDPPPYRENGTGTVYTFRARDPQGRPVSWTVAGTDGHAFEIGSSGALTFRSPPDFENPTDSNGDNRYEIGVVVTDDQGLTDRVDVTVTVINHAEGVEPTISTRRPPTTYRENGTSAVYTFRATDPQRQTITWTLEGIDRGDFTLTPDSSGRGVLAFSTPPDFEIPADSDRQNDYELTVIATDEDGHADRLSFTVTVTDFNEGPEISRVGSAPGSVLENQDPSLVLARYSATDPENPTAQIARWSTSGTDGGDFVINEQGELRFKNTPDYERPADSNRDNVYVFTVRAYDGRVYGTFEETVMVTPVNEPPTITTTSGSATELRQDENRTSRLYTYKATDPERGTITWSVGGPDGIFFTIDERGQFSFSETNPPDFEQPGDSGGDNVYNVTIQATDDGFNSGTLDVTVTVRGVNEGPEISRVGSAPGSVLENQDPSLVLARYSATDPENPTAQIARWSTSGTDGGDFVINEQGELRFKNTPDYERPADSNRDNTYVFTVRAYDGRVYGSFEETVTVTPVNEPPTITTTSRSATELSQAENRISRLYTYKATDPERATITWSVVGIDGRFFTIDERGQFSFSETNPPDFEQPGDSGRDNVYNVTVQAQDDGFNSGRLDVVVTVTDVNEGPEISGQSTFTIAENQGLPNAVYTATDPEGANVALWSVGGRDGGDFFITQGGTLYFRTPPDYERPADSNRDNVYEVSVQASDGRNTGSYPVTVTVTGVNEPPEFRRGSSMAFTQTENRTPRLYTYRATDPEGSTVTWSLGGVDGSHFTIDERGQFSFDENNPPNFDAPGNEGGDNIYNVTIQALDDQLITASLPVTVTVTEVNEGPVITRQGNAPGSVPENLDQSRVLARYTASDPERPSVQITRWSTAGPDGGDFVINALGELRFRNSPDHERPADANRDNVYEVTIRASDGRNTGTLEEVQMVTVTDVNEAPTITTTSRTAFSQSENRTSTLYTFRATEPEGSTVAWTPGGADGSAFTIDERGALFFANPPDFENPGDAGGDNVYNVTVQARDDAFNTASLDVTVTVTDHNEGVEPTISTRRPPSTYRENGTSIIYTFRASDPQRGAINWSVTGADSGFFAISESGALTFNSPPDFESPTDGNRDNEYELAVVATDDEGNSDRVDFTITVTNHNEGVEPTISTRRPPSTYRENDTRTVYTFRASDPQRGEIRWSLTGADTGDFTITKDSSGRGALTFDDPPDFENPVDSNEDNEYELAVVATDEDNHADRVAFTITVTDIDEAPVIRLEGTATTSVPENHPDTQVLADYTATDPEDPTANIFRWSTAGRDGGDFVINELGELRFRSSPDYERPADADKDNIYEVIVRASDGRSYGMLEEPLRVTVGQVNEAPVITTKSRTEFTLRENFTAVLYTYRATDQDEDAELTWSVEGTDGEDFAIYNGALTFRNLPDLETPVDDDGDNVYEITVVAADQGGLRDTVDAAITITDQAEGPVIAGRTSFTVTENYDITQELGTYTATDAKDNRPVYPRWSLSGRDGGDFVIDSVSGVLSFRNTPDFDRPADSNRDNIYEVNDSGPRRPRLWLPERDGYRYQRQRGGAGGYGQDLQYRQGKHRVRHLHLPGHRPGPQRYLHLDHGRQ